MKHRAHAGTDIAMIGLWDPAFDRRDLEKAKFGRLIAGIRAEAENGRLFFINTVGDGGWWIDILVDETPDHDFLSMYTKVDREFLIHSQSGRLVAGGVEDFTRATKQITVSADEFFVPEGRYALTLYRLDEEKLAKGLNGMLGAEDEKYYEQQWSGIPWGCILPLLGGVILIGGFFLFSILSVVISAILSSVIFCVWSVYLHRWQRRLKSDGRYQEIDRRINEYESRFPELVFVLRRVADAEQLAGGWFEWK